MYIYVYKYIHIYTYIKIYTYICIHVYIHAVSGRQEGEAKMEEERGA